MKPATTTETQPLLKELATVINDVAGAVGRFRVQLALGEAEAVEILTAQKKKVAAELHRAENFITSLIPAEAENHPAQIEIDQARLKIEILRLHFHFAEMSEEACTNKIQELKTRINLMPGNIDAHDHLLSVEEEIKAARRSEQQGDSKNK